MKTSVRRGLKPLREACGFTQPEVFNLTGIRQDRLSKLETGHANIKSEEVARLSDLYKRTRLEIFRRAELLVTYDLEQRSNVAKSVIGRIENHQEKPKYETWRKLAAVFETTPEFLMGKTTPKGMTYDSDQIELF